MSTGFASWQRYCTALCSRCQPNFAVLNRGRHLYSAGRPSWWALAHFLVFVCIVIEIRYLFTIFYYYNLSMYDQNVVTTAIGLQSTLNRLFGWLFSWYDIIAFTTTTPILRPFFRDHQGEPVPEENFWTLWCKGRLTEADTCLLYTSPSPRD